MRAWASAQTSSLSSVEPPDPPREFRGVWIPTVRNLDWPSKPGLTREQQQQELLAMLDKAAELHFNAVVFQVRPCADALYESRLEPWSEVLTGTQGESPGWDPLEFAVREGRRRCLQVHAWLNPYRAAHPSDKSAKALNHLSRLRPDLVKTYGKYLWLDPGEPEVAQHSRNVVLDIIRRYDVDAIHFDDYFYPYPERGDDGKLIPFPDDPSWAKYVKSGGTLTREDWRRDNVNRFVESTYRAIKREKPWILFGLSPFGSWRPNHPPGARTMDAYNDLYADSRKWWHSGWVDYLAPQIYWQMKNPDHGFPRMYAWWAEENRMKRHLWPGLVSGEVLVGAARGWTIQDILDPIAITRKSAGAPGTIHFRMSWFMKNAPALNDRLLSGPYAARALVPASPWLATAAPAPPRAALSPEVTAGSTPVLTWTAGDSASVAHWCFYQRTGETWHWAPLPAVQTQTIVGAPSNSASSDAVAISAVDRTGQESARVIIPLRKE